MEAARKGEYRCYVELWRNCDNNEKDRITQTVKDWDLLLEIILTE